MKNSLLLSVVSDDGVHVDMNNGKHFHHTNVLFHITTNTDTGTTTFPFANKLFSTTTGTISTITNSFFL